MRSPAAVNLLFPLLFLIMFLLYDGMGARCTYIHMYIHTYVRTPRLPPPTYIVLDMHVRGAVIAWNGLKFSSISGPIYETSPIPARHVWIVFCTFVLHFSRAVLPLYCFIGRWQGPARHMHCMEMYTWPEYRYMYARLRYTRCLHTLSIDTLTQG